MSEGKMSISSNASIEELPADDEPILITAEYEQDTSPVRLQKNVKFPTHAYTTVWDGLNRLQGWTAHCDKLSDLLKKMILISENKQRLGGLPAKMMEKTISDIIPDIFPKILDDTSVQNWQYRIQWDILDCCMKLLQFTVVRLKDLAEAQNQDDIHDIEIDLMSLLPALTLAFDSNTHFHIKNRDEDLPGRFHITDEIWAKALPETDIQDQTADSEITSQVEPVSQFLWLEHLINNFGEDGGIEHIQLLLSHPSRQSLQCADLMLSPLAKASSLLTSHTTTCLRKGMEKLLRFIQEDFLNDTSKSPPGPGQTQNMQGLSSLLEKVDILLTAGGDAIEAEQMVGKVRREFILRLLAQGNFNMYLSAVRETNTLLMRALNVRKLDQGNAVRVNMEWMRKHDVVKNLLRANLHQKQYVDQVQKVLKNLTIEGGLQADHLDLLWNLTEKVDTFEVVKNNIFDMLGDLAQDFDNEQLDRLFKKFEACSDRPVTDAMKIMDVMRRFAASDTKGVMAKRVMDFLWSMMMNPEAPAEISRSPAMTDALTSYAHRQGVMDRKVAYEYIKQCVAQIQNDHSVSAAMNLLQRLVHLSFRENLLSANQKESDTKDDFSLIDTVIGSLERCIEKRRGTFSSSIQDVAYDAILTEHATFLVSLPSAANLQLSWAQVQRLWNALIDNPASSRDRILGLRLINELAVQRGIPTIIMDQLLEEKVDHVQISTLVERENLEFWSLVATTLGQVSNSPKPLDQEGEAPKTLCQRITGLPILWRIVLDMNDDAIDKVLLAQRTVVSQYANIKVPEEIKKIRSEFVQTCLAALHTSANVLIGDNTPKIAETPTSEQILAARRAARSLSLLQDFVCACQGKSMPSLPKHAASFRGNQRKFDVTGAPSANARGKVTCHSNMYIGQLRNLIAEKLNNPPQVIRLFAAGKELNSDAGLIKDEILPELSTILTAISPVSNPFSNLPAEKNLQIENSSPATLLAHSTDIFGLLLDLADFCEDGRVRHNAIRLLDILPTAPLISNKLSEALLSENPQEAMRSFLSPEGQASKPARLLYILQALNALLFPVTTNLDEDGGESPAQKAFICSGCVSVLIEAVTNAPSHQSTIGTSIVRNLFQATQLLFGQLLLTSTKLTCKNDDTVMTDSSPSSPSIHTQGQKSSEQEGNVDEIIQIDEIQRISALDQHTLSILLMFNLNMIIQAGRHWLPKSSPYIYQGHGNELQDALICQNAFNAVRQLLELCPDLYNEILSNKSHCETLSLSLVESLLNSSSDSIRLSAFNFGQRLAISSQIGHNFLLTLLSDLSKADQQPTCCFEYYSLVTELIKLQANPQTEEELSNGVAEHMLNSLVQECQILRSANDESDLRILVKLKLIQILVQALDNRDVGQSGSGNLIEILITKFLFPESTFLCALGDQNFNKVPSNLIDVAFENRCATSDDRQAALDLLQELMSHHSTNLQQGMELIRKIHFSKDILKTEVLAFKPTSVIKKLHSFVGLKNGGATCYMNSIFQQLFMQPSIRRCILSAPEIWAKDQPDNVFFQLQSVFANLALTNKDTFLPKGFWKAFKDYDGQELNIREHQDGYEFFTRLQDVVDQQMKILGRKPAMQLVMGGKFAQQIICKSVAFRSEKEEDFYQVSLDVRGKRNLQESLDFYVQGELMEGDNQYLCESLGKKVDAVKRNCIKVLPHMLVIHLKRFEYDYESMNRWKVKDRFEFPEELDMFNYTVSGLAAKEARMEAEANGREIPPLSPKTEAYKSQCHYRLAGVVVHSGTAFAGHYYSYIKMRQERGGRNENAGSWFCFDDTTVSPWDISDLDASCFGGKYRMDVDSQFVNKEFDRPNSAYLLFYERSEDLEPIENLDSLTLEVVTENPAEPSPMKDDSTDIIEEEEEKKGQKGITPGILETSGNSALANLLAVPIADISKSIPTVYNEILHTNLKTLQEVRVFDRQYFKFIYSLVKENTEVPFLPPSSIRRTEASSSGPSTSSPSNRTSDSSALSQRRDDSVDRAAECLINFAGQFLIRVYLKCIPALRDDQDRWFEVIKNILDTNVAANRWFLYLMAFKSHNFTSLAHPDLSTLETEIIDNFLIWSNVEDISKFVSDLMLTAIRNAFRKESIHFRGKLDQNGSSRAITFILIGFSHHLSKDGLLEKNRSLHYFFTFLRDFALIGASTREYLLYRDFLRVLLNHLRLPDALVQAHAVSILEVVSPLLRSLQCGPASSSQRPNPYSIEGNYRDRQVIHCYETVIRGERYRELILNPYNLKSSEHVFTLAQFLSWKSKDWTLSWINRLNLSLRTVSASSLEELIPTIVKMSLVEDEWYKERVKIFLGNGNKNLVGFAVEEGVQPPKRFQLISLLMQLHRALPVRLVNDVYNSLEKLLNWLEKLARQQNNIVVHKDFSATLDYLKELCEDCQVEEMESDGDSQGESEDSGNESNGSEGA